MLLPVNDPVFMKCASQAREDWEAFLLHRARELVSGDNGNDNDSGNEYDNNTCSVP